MKKIIFICLIALGSTLTMNAQCSVQNGAGGVRAAPSFTVHDPLWGLLTNAPQRDLFAFGIDSTLATGRYSWIQPQNGYLPYPCTTTTTAMNLSLNPLGGNVGVGLNAPASLFHSAGQISTGIPSGGLGGASATTGSLLFYNSSNSNTINIQSGATTPSNYTWTLPLAQGAASTVLTNDGSGVLSWSNPNTGIASTAWLLAGNTLTGTLPASPTEFIGTINESDWVIKTYSSERMRVKSGGNVGIGTTAPSSKFHVNDGYIYISDPATAHGMTSIVPTDVIGSIGKNNASGGLAVTGLNEDGTGNGLALIGYIGGGSTSNPAVRVMGAVKSGTTFTVVPDTALLFSITNSTSSTKLSVTGNGNLGVGTTTPGYLLEVAGQSSIGNKALVAYNDEFWTQPQTNGNAVLYINKRGYLDNTTQYRDLDIRNGKAGNIAFFQGSTSRVGIGTTVLAPY